MTEYPINIDLKVKGQGSLNSLMSSLERIETTSKQTADGIKLLNNAINSVKGGGNLQKIATELQNINKTGSETATTINKINFSKMTANLGRLKSIDETLKTLLKTVEELKSNSNIRINVDSNARQVTQELNSLNRVSTRTRKHTYRTGSRNGYNYYGFNADENPYYQKATPILQVGRGMQRIGEKAGLVGANLMMAGSFLGARELSETIIETPAKAETQKYLLTNMQGSASITSETGGTTTLYKTLDKTTDALPISMQNVVQPLYAFKAASGATAQEINNIIPEFANFGAQVINMTGSEDQAEEAMQKLSRAYQGQYAAVDQYGITKESLENVGYQEGGSIEEFMDAVTKITGDARESMNNFNGMKALVGKDFSRAGKQLWNNGVGQAMSALVGGFHNLDQEMGGFSTQLIVGAAGFLELATTFTTVIGSIGTTIGTFGQMYGNLQMIRKNGGGITGAIKGVFDGVNSAGIYGTGAYGFADDMIDNGAMQTAVYEGALTGTRAGMMGIQTQGRNSSLGTLYDNEGNPLDHSSFEERARINQKHNDKTSQRNKRLGESAAQSQSFTNQLRANKEIEKTTRKSKKFAESLQKGSIKTGDIKLRNKLNHALRGSTHTIKSAGRGLGKFVSGIGGMIGTGGALTLLSIGAMAVGGALSYAAAHSEKVATSEKQVSNALGNLAHAATSRLGDFFNKLGWTGNRGESAAFDFLADKLTDLANAINLLAGDDENTARDKQLQLEDMKKGPGEQASYEKVKWNLNFTTNGDGTSNPDTIQDKYLRQYISNREGFWQTREANAGAYDQSMNAIGIQSNTAEIERAKKNFENDYIKLFHTNDDLMAEYNRIGDKFFNTPEYQHMIDYASSHRDESAQDIENKRKQGYFSNPSNLSKEYDEWDKEHKSKLARDQASGREKRDASESKERGASSETRLMGGNGNVALLAALPSNAVNTTQQQQPSQSFDIGKWLSGLFINNTQQQGQTPQGQGTTGNIAGDGTQAGMEYATQFNSGFQQGMATTPINTDQLLGGAGGEGNQDMLMKGTDWGNQFATGVSTGINSATIDTSGLTTGLDSAASQMGEKGTNAGNSFKNNFQSSISGASGIAQGEADAVVAALQSSIEGARAAGEAAGSAYHEGFESKADVHSPGIAARTALKEANYLVEFLHRGVSGARLAGERTASAYTSSIATLSGHSANGLNIAESISSTMNNVSNGLTGLNSSAATDGTSENDNSNTNKSVVINNNFHIDKIDSKERVKEIAETLVHIMTFNNETAGRNTSTGL